MLFRSTSISKYCERLKCFVIRSANSSGLDSLDTVRTNAEQFGASYDNELHRVIIHGILHLCGINDKGPGEREIMEAAENKALAMLH